MVELRVPAGKEFHVGAILRVSAEIGQITDAPELDCVVNIYLFLVE